MNKPMGHAIASGDDYFHIRRDNRSHDTLCSKEVIGLARGLITATCPECLRLYAPEPQPDTCIVYKIESDLLEPSFPSVIFQSYQQFEHWLDDNWDMAIKDHPYEDTWEIKITPVRMSQEEINNLEPYDP